MSKKSCTFVRSVRSDMAERDQKRIMFNLDANIEFASEVTTRVADPDPGVLVGSGFGLNI